MRHITSMLLSFLLAKSGFAGMPSDLWERLQHDNPANYIPGYTTNPNEANLKPEEDADALRAHATEKIRQNIEARTLYERALNRPKVQGNSNSKESKEAAELIEAANAFDGKQCFKANPNCQAQYEQASCSEFPQYSDFTCNRRLTIVQRTVQESFNRVTRVSRYQTHITLNLAECDGCTEKTEGHIQENCDALSAEIQYRGRALPLISQPSCQNPIAVVASSGVGSRKKISLHIKLVQTIHEDKWQEEGCGLPKTAQSCRFLESVCTDSNASKAQNGRIYQRPCWSEQSRQRCMMSINGDCQAVLARGCRQTGSVCAQSSSQGCVRYEQHFECALNECKPIQVPCEETAPMCADGSCDNSQEEKNTEAGTSISRLAALFGVAQDAAEKQLSSKEPNIFSGTAKECKKTPLRFRDCCTDSGWGDWIKHCPPDLQELQKAKADGRVFYIGEYKKHDLGNTHFSFCVFPSKLAAIIRIEGGLYQLQKGFGDAKHPNCQGLSPVEIEHLDFERLNLKPIEDDILARKRLPEADALGQRVRQRAEEGQ